MISGTLDRDRRERVSTDAGSVAVHRNYIITSEPDGSPSPQAYLVEQAPNDTLRAHFHFNSQFQIFVSGAGTIGRHVAKPYVVQYAEAQTGYGPITAGDGGLAYLTLRPTTIKKRAQYLPEAKDLLDRGVPKRQAVSVLVDGAADAHSDQVMIEPTPDGLGAWFITVPAGSSKPAPELCGGNGRFYVVVRGELQTQDATVKAVSVLWLGPDEGPLRLQATGEPLSVIVAQFPQSAW